MACMRVMFFVGRAFSPGSCLIVAALPGPAAMPPPVMALPALVASAIRVPVSALPVACIIAMLIVAGRDPVGARIRRA